MDKKWIILLITLINIMLSGCSTPDSTDLTPSTPPITPETPVVPSGQSPAPSVPQALETQPVYTSFEDKYLVDFTGVKPTKESARPVNSPFSNLYTFGSASVFCYDDENAMLYYGNYGDWHNNISDNYLYAYKDGQSELLLEMPVNYLNYYDGAVYFISNENIIDLYGWYYYPFGKLYKYTIADKNTELLLDMNVFMVSIIDGFLYFRSAFTLDGHTSVTDGEFYRMPINGGELENCGDLLPFFYGEYRLRYAPTDEEGDKRAVELVSETETIRVTNGAFSWYDVLLAPDGDLLWFRYTTEDERGIASINLENGETAVYPFDIKEGSMTSFTVIEDTIFLCGGVSNLYLFEKDAREFTEVSPSVSQNYTQVYAHGGELYALGTDGDLFGGDYIRSVLKIIPNGDGTYREEKINP